MMVEISALDLLQGAGNAGIFGIAAGFWLHELKIRWHHDRLRRIERKLFPNYFSEE